MNNIVFLTGGTGFIGTQIARRLIKDTIHTILVLVRAENEQAASNRLARAWWDWQDLRNETGKRIHAIIGDVSKPNLDIESTVYKELIQKITHIIHCAADWRVNAPIDELRRTNVKGTANLLELAQAVHKDHGLIRFSHVSTAYVAGGRTGLVPEDTLSDEYGFTSAYEFSKYEGEKLIQEAKKNLPISVFRPGMVIGDSRSGAIKTFNTIYFPLRLFLTGKLPIVPASPNQRINLIPVDYVTDAIVHLTFEPKAESLNFHLTAPYNSLPKARELTEFVQIWVKKRLGLRLSLPIFIPLPVRRGGYKPTSKKQSRVNDLSSLLNLLPYFNERIEFGRDNVDRLFGSYELKWQDFLPKILEYGVYMGFMHRSERTVHEQIIRRLENKRRKITYHDIIDGKVKTQNTFEVRQEMLNAANALKALGISPEDRVAIVGLNSTRYLILDVAIGLIGAISVPLYYTSPPAEIDMILQASGAKFFLVGAPKILERLNEIKTDLPVVAFCRNSVPNDIPRKVMTWKEFMAKGEDKTIPVMATVKPDDIATIRYTSGTTGKPKGVVFNHANLRWMGECIASLLPWKEKNQKASYLSFLPMNHVVEGILATYSPYYVPTSINIYFLENFRDIQKALRLVRPIVFFSVPRIYEKIWEGLVNNRIGKLYLGLKEGIIKKLIRWIVRKNILNKAGLNHCAQLIVGSAPASEYLLRSFQELGIEIHNAYGLTEAPLVTINRLGANPPQADTVGEPLPETKISLAEDGEVMVKGPQVTAGYFETAETPFSDGWLMTGDLGYLTKQGSLVLYGRKKELIKTSYGKYIHPVKVETLLQQIPDVVSSMLVGEQKPFCTAILWVKQGYANETGKRIDKAVVEVNHQLSNPEKVKRWAILAHDLSIEQGDLTANLKLKRQVVANRLKNVIDALYDKANPPDIVLHLGQAEQSEPE